MIAEILILAFLTLVFLRSKPTTILYILFLLLPIHGTIKNVYFPNGGELFAIWKEFAILILFIKTYRNKATSELFSFYHWFLLLLIYSFSYSIYSYYSGIPFMSELKKIIFPFLIFYAVSKMQLNSNQMKYLLIILAVGSVIINITGIIDFANPSLRLVFRDIMKIGYTFDANGNIYYDQNSFTIMGFNRTCGLMSGGPNQMGVYNALVLFTCIIYLSFYKARRSIFMQGAAILSFFCLLTSFSRAGMAILIMTYTFYFSKQKPTMILKFIFALSVLAAIVLVLSIPYPQISEVIEGTLTGKEASSAERGNMTMDAINFILEHPLGFGIGASAAAQTGFAKHAYFAESSLLNLTIGFGIIGFLFLTILYYKTYKCLKVSNSVFASLGSCFLLANYICSFVSVNPYETPYIYISWILLGLFCANNICPHAESQKIL